MSTKKNINNIPPKTFQLQPSGDTFKAWVAIIKRRKYKKENTTSMHKSRFRDKWGSYSIKKTKSLKKLLKIKTTNPADSLLVNPAQSTLSAQAIQKIKNKAAYEQRVKKRRVRIFKKLVRLNKFRKVFRRKFKVRKPGKWRLKKKWRFWRFYKNFFLFHRRKKLFTKLRWLFNQRRVLFYQLSYVYGSSSFKKKISRQNKRSTIFNGAPFFKLLSLLEFRLYIFIYRVYFTKSTKSAIALIKNNQVLVNGQSKSKNYTVKPQDLIQRLGPQVRLNEWKRWSTFHWRKWSLFRRVKHLWYRSPWNLFTKKSRKKFRFYNVVEVSNKIDAAIVLRNLKFNEFRLRDKTNRKSILKKIYRLF